MNSSHETTQTLLSHLLSRTCGLPLLDLLSCDLRLHHLSAKDFEARQLSGDSLLLSNSDLSLELKLSNANSASRTLQIKVHPLEIKTSVREITLFIASESTHILSPIPNQKTDSVVAVINNYGDRTLSRLSVSLDLQPSVAGDYIATLHCYDSFRGDLRTTIGTIAMVVEPERWDLASMFISSPWERRLADAHWRVFAPIFISDDVAPESLSKICKENRITHLLVPSGSILSNFTLAGAVQLVAYESDADQFRTYLGQTCGTVNHRVIAPREPEYALIAAWYARRRGKSLYLYDSLTELDHLSLTETDELIVHSDDGLDARSISTIVAGTPGELNVALLKRLESPRSEAQFQWLCTAADSMLEGVGSLLSRFLESNSLREEFTNLVDFNSTAVVINCSPSSFAKLILGAAYAAGKEASLYYFGVIDTNGSEKIWNALERVKTLVEISRYEAHPPPANQSKDPKESNSSEPEFKSTSPHELIVQSLARLSEVISENLSREVNHLITNRLPHYVTLIGDTKIPLDYVLLGRGGHALLTIGNVCAVGHLEFQSNFLTTQSQINSLMYSVPRAVSGLNLLLANPTLDLELTEAETAHIENILVSNGDENNKRLVRHDVSSEAIADNLSRAKLLYYSGHGTIIEDRLPALVLHGKNGYQPVLLDDVMTPTQIPALVVFNGCVTSFESLAANVGFASKFLSLGALAFIGASETVMTWSSALIGLGLIRNHFYLPFGDSLLFAKHALATVTVGQIEQAETHSNEGTPGYLDLSWLSFQLYGDPSAGHHHGELLASSLFLENLSDVYSARAAEALASTVRTVAATCYYQVAQLYDRQPEGGRLEMLQQAYLVLGESLTTLSLESEVSDKPPLLQYACKAFEKSREYAEKGSLTDDRVRMQLLQSEALLLSSLASQEGVAEIRKYELERDAFFKMNRSRKLAKQQMMGRAYEGFALQYAAYAYGHKGKYYSDLGEFDLAFRYMARSAKYFQESVKRNTFLGEALSGRLKQARSTMAWVGWRDAGVRLVSIKDYEGALSRLAECSTLFELIGETDNAILVGAEAACITLLANLETLTSGKVSSEELPNTLTWMSLGWQETLIAFRIFSVSSENENDYPHIISKQYLLPIVSEAISLRTQLLHLLEQKANLSLSQAVLVFHCCSLAWLRALGAPLETKDELWKTYKMAFRASTQNQNDRDIHQILMWTYYALRAQSPRTAIIRLAKATEWASKVALFQFQILLELCSHSILGGAFAEAEKLPASQAARIYTFVARQSDGVAKPKYYAMASKCWLEAGDIGKSSLYRAMSSIFDPMHQNNLQHTQDDLVLAASHLEPETFESNLCQDNIWAVQVQLLIQQSQSAVGKGKHDNARMLADDAVKKAESKPGILLMDSELLQRAKCWKDVSEAIILILSTDEQESRLSQAQIRRRYYFAYKLLRRHQDSFVDSLVRHFKNKAEGEFYYHAGFKIFDEQITSRNLYRSLRYAKFFLKSGDCFRSTELEDNSYNHAFQLLGAYHYACANDNLTTGKLGVAKYHVAHGLRYYSDAYARRLRADSPQTLLYKYRILELRRLDELINFQQAKNPQHLWMATNFAKSAYDILLRAGAFGESIADPATVKEEYERLVQLTESLGMRLDR